jgi:hypothetical protein
MILGRFFILMMFLSVSISLFGQSNRATKRQNTRPFKEENVNSASTQRVRKVKEPKLSDNRFRFGALLGPLLSQVDGDGYSGYDKLGFYSGIKGEAVITRNFFLEIDLMYNRLGSKFPGLTGSSKQNNSRVLGFDYAEVPFVLNLSIPKNDFFLNLEGGVSIMQLISTSITEDASSAKIVNLTELSKEFNKRSYAAIVGVEIQFDRLSFGTRASISMSNTYYNEEWFAANRRNEDTSRLLPLLRNYYVALYTSYTFIGSIPKR